MDLLKEKSQIDEEINKKLEEIEKTLAMLEKEKAELITELETKVDSMIAEKLKGKSISFTDFKKQHLTIINQISENMRIKYENFFENKKRQLEDSKETLLLAKQL